MITPPPPPPLSPPPPRSISFVDSQFQNDHHTNHVAVGKVPPFNPPPPPPLSFTPAADLPRTPYHPAQIEHFGGYENVARRLHLGYHYKDETEYQHKIAGLLKERFEKDLSVSDYYVQLQREAMTEQEQRLALRREIKDGVRLLQAQAERALLRRR